MVVFWYDRVIRVLVFAAFSIMLGAALAGTVSRYLTFLPSVSWGEEVTRFSGIWAVFLVSGISIRRGAHLGVDLLTRHLPPRGKRFMAIAVCCLITAFSLLLLVYGLRISFDNMTQYSAALQWRMGFVYLCIPIGGALMLLEIPAMIWRTLRDLPDYFPSDGEGPE